MIKYHIEFSVSASKSLADLPKKIQLRIQGVVATLESNPLPPVATQLVGRDAYRIRVSDYRIVYTIHKDILTITVISVGHRREIYRKS